MNNLVRQLAIPVLWLALIATPHKAVYPQDSESVSVATQTPKTMMWRDPVDIEQRDLFYGIGGRDNAPDASGTYTLVDQRTTGTQPKMIVDDAQGRRWVLKSGPEARPETTATRIVWAAGYHVDQDYFLPNIQVVGARTLNQTDVRLERFEPPETDQGQWSWESNPFLGTREFDGLKVLVALLRDGDVKDRNNQIRQITRDGAPVNVYYISDLGATLGSNGSTWNIFPLFRNLPPDRLTIKAAKGNPETFLDGKMIKKVTHGEVIFSSKRSSVSRVLRGVSITNARWMGEILGRLSDAQLRDAFRAGGFSDEETGMYISTLRDRINELRNLAPDHPHEKKDKAAGDATAVH